MHGDHCQTVSPEGCTALLGEARSMVALDGLGGEAAFEPRALAWHPVEQVPPGPPRLPLSPLSPCRFPVPRAPPRTRATSLLL